MSPDSPVWFKSKVDWWLGAILVAVPLIEVWTLISALRRGDAEALDAALLGCGIVAAIYVLLLVPIRYGIAEDHLLVRFGIVRQRIPFESILEIYPTHNLLSSAALSIDRLAIKTGRGPMSLTLISPVDRDEFMSYLAGRAHLVWDGQRWIRRSDA